MKKKNFARPPLNEGNHTKNTYILTEMPSNKLICLCKQVSEQEIAVVLRKNPTYGIEEIRLSTGASTSCGRCASELANFVATKSKKRDFKQLKLF